MIDIHSHILPGIDDGAKDLDDSIRLVAELARQGVTDVIATPHYVEDTIYTSNVERNKRLIEVIRAHVSNANIPINLYLGNEIYINDNISELIERGEISPLAGGKYLLVELSLSGEYPNYEGIFDDLIRKGYKVILAHPERYSSVQNDFSKVENLAKMGVLFQCNLGSIVGQYGKHAKKTLKKLAKAKMIFAFGSDIHHPHATDEILLAKKKLSKYYSREELETVLYENPRKIIG